MLGRRPEGGQTEMGGGGMRDVLLVLWGMTSLMWRRQSYLRMTWCFLVQPSQALLVLSVLSMQEALEPH